MTKDTRDEAVDKIRNVISNTIEPEELVAHRSFVLSQIRTGKEDPEKFLSQLKDHFGYLYENWFDLVLFDRQTGIGFVNDDISLSRAKFEGESYMTMFHMPGRNKTKLKVYIPDISFRPYKGEGLAVRRVGFLPMRCEMEFYVGPEGKMTRCYYDLSKLDEQRENLRHNISQGSFETHDLKRFTELVKKIEYIMIGTTLSIYTSGAFVGLIAKEGEYFIR